MYTLKAVWLGVPDSLGTCDHLIAHCVGAWGWEEAYGSSSLLSEVPHLAWKKVSLTLCLCVVSLEPGRILPFTQ